MLKDITVVGLISLGLFGAAGCHSQRPMRDDQAVAMEEAQPQALVPLNQIPDDVMKTVKEHVLQPNVIRASTITWKGDLAYKLYVKSGNTVYILKIRPDGYFLKSSIDGE